MKNGSAGVWHGAAALRANAHFIYIGSATRNETENCGEICGFIVISEDFGGGHAQRERISREVVAALPAIAHGHHAKVAKGLSGRNRGAEGELVAGGQWQRHRRPNRQAGGLPYGCDISFT